jgi:hypothetical protein
MRFDVHKANGAWKVTRGDAWLGSFRTQGLAMQRARQRARAAARTGSEKAVVCLHEEEGDGIHERAYRSVPPVVAQWT